MFIYTYGVFVISGGQVIFPGTGAHARVRLSDVDQGSLLPGDGSTEQRRHGDAVSQLHGKVGRGKHRAACMICIYVPVEQRACAEW